ncbi:MAG TPA: hypothetical protein VHW65_07960 [Gemmatimonadales bacterium]|nr:hypothetical protein [Gemmatimonadales bacterium]
MDLSPNSLIVSGVLLITIPTVEYGGVALLKMLRSSEPGYLDNPLRQNLFRAGHAHAGVLLLLSLISQPLADVAFLPLPLRWFARLAAPAAAILMPLGFFLSVASPRATTPGPAIRLVYVGAIILALGVVTLGVGLIRSGVQG